MLGEIILCMTISADFSPKDIVIAFAEGTQQAGQSDDRQIGPAKKLTVNSMPKLMHTNLMPENEALPFAVHPRACPKINESA